MSRHSHRDSQSSSSTVPVFTPVSTFRTRTSPRRSNYFPSPQQQQPAFVPPQQYRSRASPSATPRLASGHAEIHTNAGEHSPVAVTPQPPPDHLVGSTHPVAENLEASTAGDAFNVDPASTMLGPAGGSATNLPMPSPPTSPPQSSGGRFVGGFVTGLRKAMRSVRRPREQNPEIGFAPGQAVRSYFPSDTSSSRASTLTGTAYEVTPFPPGESTYVSHSPQDPVPAPYPTPPPRNFSRTRMPVPSQPSQPSLPSPSSAVLDSPVSIEPPLGPDYARMELLPSPPPSDPSINTYLTRFKQLVDNVRALPWVAPERVTADYYPGTTERRGKRRSHRPAVSWRPASERASASGSALRRSLDLLSSGSPSPTVGHVGSPDQGEGMTPFMMFGPIVPPKDPPLNSAILPKNLVYVTPITPYLPPNGMYMPPPGFYDVDTETDTDAEWAWEQTTDAHQGFGSNMATEGHVDPPIIPVEPHIPIGTPYEPSYAAPYGTPEGGMPYIPSPQGTQYIPPPAASMTPPRTSFPNTGANTTNMGHIPHLPFSSSHTPHPYDSQRSSPTVPANTYDFQHYPTGYVQLGDYRETPFGDAVHAGHRVAEEGGVGSTNASSTRTPSEVQPQQPYPSVATGYGQ